MEARLRSWDLKDNQGNLTSRGKAACALLLVALALLSALVLAPFASSPDTYTNTISTLDEKKTNVLALLASTTGISTALSALPGDAATPLANKILDLSSYCMVILSIIYLEKFLATTIGAITFLGLVPAGCVLLAVSLLFEPDSRAKLGFQKLAIKLVVFGVAMAFVIPTSTALSVQIDNSFEESLNANAQTIQESTDSLQDEMAAGETSDSTNEESSESILDSISDAVQSGVESLTQEAQNAIDAVGDKLNEMIDTLAVMIVTSCLIPLIVLFLFFWLVKTIVGLDIGSPTRVFESSRAYMHDFTKQQNESAGNHRDFPSAH